MDLLLELLQLNELFNSKVTIGRGDIYHETDTVLEIRKQIAGKLISFKANLWKNKWDIEFSEIREDEDGKEYDFYHATKDGTKDNPIGHANLILAFVIEGMKELIDSKDPRTMYFTASKTDRNRAKVYERLIKRELPHYLLKVEDHKTGSIEFTLTKK